MSNFQARDHTAIAVISWLDENKQTQARLYTQDYSGNIRESCYDGKSWSADAARNVVAKARSGTAIAACRFQGINHVFYIKDADGNYINGVYEVAPGEWLEDSIHESGLRSTVVGYLAALPSPQDQPGPRGTHYTLYYQGTDQRIYRMLSSGVESKWLKGGSFVGKGEASLGTGLAAANFEDTDSDGIYPATRIFYQTSDASSVTYVTVGRDFDSFQDPDDQDLINRTKGLINVVTPLCAISTGNAGNPAFQLYARNKDVSVGEWGYYSRGWKHENRLGIPFPYATDIAMFRSSDPTIHKIYVQVQRTDRPEILEYSAENAFGPWELSTVVPT